MPHNSEKFFMRLGIMVLIALLSLYPTTEAIAFTIGPATWEVVISVKPPGSGNIRPLGRGVHYKADGSKLQLKPVANAGWEFEYWIVNGKKVKERLLTITITQNYHITAYFRKKTLNMLNQSKSVSSTATEQMILKGCEIDLRALSYRGNYGDVMAVKDLLYRFSGKATPFQELNLLLLGKGKDTPQPWSYMGVEVADMHIKAGGEVFLSEKGKEYGLIYFDCIMSNVYVTGATPQGTRIALQWLLNNKEKALGKLLIIVEWKDVNKDNSVQENELQPVFEIP